MIKFAIYLLESSALLAVFYLLYAFFMKKETFFEFNRFFLLAIVVFSLLFPLVSFDISQGKIAAVDSPVEEISKFRMSYYDAMADWEYEQINASENIAIESQPNEEVTVSNIDWLNIFARTITGIYVLGILFCLSKILWSIRSLVKMIRIYPKEKIEGVTVVKVPKPVSPFSFFKFAFVYEGIIDQPELKQIIIHEKTHIQQRHSIDLLFIQFLAAFLWFNPLIWKLIKSLKTTHEYIADKKIINSGYSLVEYQTLLLRQLISNSSLELVHYFNLSFIKKRITMMTNNQSGIKGILKVAFSLTLAASLSLILIQCNSKVDQEASVESELNAFLEKYKAENKVETINFEEGQKYTLVGSDTLWRIPELTIANDQLQVDGVPHTIDDIAGLVKNVIPHGLVELKIDRNQSMKKVKEVQRELRKLNKRKVVYYGETASGKQMIQPFLFAPLHWANPKGDALAPQIDFSTATINGKVATLNGVEYLNLNLSEKSKVNYREEVFNFVYSHVSKGSLAYVIKAEFDETDTFENYLTNLADVFQGFDKVYQAHAKNLYNKDYDELKILEKVEVSKATPKAVFIAES